MKLTANVKGIVLAICLLILFLNSFQILADYCEEIADYFCQREALFDCDDLCSNYDEECEYPYFAYGYCMVSLCYQWFDFVCEGEVGYIGTYPYSCTGMCPLK